MNRLLLALTLLLAAPALCASPFELVSGTWTGAVQFNARLAPDAHSVGKLALFVQPDGSVQGEHANGCKLSGIIKRFASETSFSLDVNVKGCAFSGYNRRWQGHFNVQPKDRTGSFRLNASDIKPSQPVQIFDAEGTLTK